MDKNEILDCQCSPGYVSDLFYSSVFFYFSKAYEESRLLNIVNYVKVQCSVYTRYNEVSECKCLIRAIDSARQVSVVIDAKTQDGKEFNNQLLEECTDQLWLTGAMVLDANGNIVGEYSESGSVDRSRFAKYRNMLIKKQYWILQIMRKRYIPSRSAVMMEGI